MSPAPATFGPPVRLDGPLPVAPLYSLLNTVQVLVEQERSTVPDVLLPQEIDRWGNSAQIYPYPIDPGFAWDPCSTGSLGDKEAGTPPPLPVFHAFTAYLPETCTSSRIVSPDYFTARAELAFAAVESAIYENVLAGGGPFHATAQPYLGDGNLVQLAGGAAVSPQEGLALLEDAIGGTHKRGLIHATPATLTAWTFTGPAIDKEGTILQTRVGTPVAVGDGYIGIVPDEASALSPTQAWAFATGPVQIRREPVITLVPEDISQALDRTHNIVTYRAERDVLVDWDTVAQYGVLVDRSIT